MTSQVTSKQGNDIESNQLNNEPDTPAQAPTIEMNDKALKLVTEESV